VSLWSAITVNWVGNHVSLHRRPPLFADAAVEQHLLVIGVHPMIETVHIGAAKFQSPVQSTKASSTQQIWGMDVLQFGYTAVPVRGLSP
jgi:hypothetical protein